MVLGQTQQFGPFMGSPSMIFLSETKMTDHRLDRVRSRMGFFEWFQCSSNWKGWWY